MSQDTTTPAGAPNATPAPATAAPATTTVITTETKVPPPAAAQQDDPNPQWLGARLDRERKSLLKELGIESVDDAKKAIADAKAKAEADKAAEVRAAEAKAKADELEKKAESRLKTIGEFAGRQMLALTDEQKAAVTALAGDDPEKQLATIAALQPTWSKQAASPPAKAPPASTAPNPNAPPATTGSTPNTRAQYESLRAVNPFAAARYGAENPDAYRREPNS